MMNNLSIKIYQGTNNAIKYADVNIIIDVIRAFTVSYYAFKNNVNEIILAKTENDAYNIKKDNKSYLICGETNGYKVKNFDFGNSPYEINNANLINKTLIQKTTNGVIAALNSLNADNIFVAGYVNIHSLIQYINKIVKNSKKEFIINIIASHPTGDDDLACAEYIKLLLLNEVVDLKELDQNTLYRILNSESAKKFLDITNNDFCINDIIMSLSMDKSDFVMEVKKENKYIKIIKKDLNV